MDRLAGTLLPPDAAEGPFDFDPKLLRADISDGMPGAPLEIAIQLSRASDCAATASTTGC